MPLNGINWTQLMQRAMMRTLPKPGVYLLNEDGTTTDIAANLIPTSSGDRETNPGYYVVMDEATVVTNDSPIAIDPGDPIEFYTPTSSGCTCYDCLRIESTNSRSLVTEEQAKGVREILGDDLFDYFFVVRSVSYANH